MLRHVHAFNPGLSAGPRAWTKQGQSIGTLRRDCVQLERMLLSLLHSRSVNPRTWMPARGGRQGPKCRQHLVVYCLLETSAAVQQHCPCSRQPMPPPRSVTESQTRPILPVTVAAAIEAGKCSSRHESRWCRGWGPNLHLAL